LNGQSFEQEVKKSTKHVDPFQPKSLINCANSFNFNTLPALATVGLLRLLIRQFQISQFRDLGPTWTKGNNLQPSQWLKRQSHGVRTTAAQPEMRCLPLRLFIKRLTGIVTRGD